MKKQKQYKCLIAVIIAFISISLQAQKAPELIISHGPWLQNLTGNSVTIMWTTSTPSVPGIMLGTNNENMELIYNSDDGMINAGDTLQKIRISGLLPGKEYQYRVYSRQIDTFEPYKITYNDTLLSQIYKFRTPDPNLLETNFIVFNDVHTNSSKMSSYLRNIDTGKQDLWVFNGDMVDYVQDISQLTKGFLDSAVYWFAKNKPFVYVRGNHEARGKQARKFKSFLDLEDDSFYSSFDLGPVHFTLLDCGEDKPDSNRYYYQLADFDRYRMKQLEWLKNEVKSNEFRNAKFRIVICHMPIYKKEKMGYGMQFLSDYFGPVLAKSNVDLMLSGHTHRYEFADKNNTGFGYPVLVNSSNTFIEVTVNNEHINVSIKDINGKTLNEHTIDKLSK